MIDLLPANLLLLVHPEQFSLLTRLGFFAGLPSPWLTPPPPRAPPLLPLLGRPPHLSFSPGEFHQETRVSRLIGPPRRPWDLAASPSCAMWGR